LLLLLLLLLLLQWRTLNAIDKCMCCSAAAAAAGLHSQTAVIQAEQ
jgi:hypothetical protein